VAVTGCGAIALPIAAWLLSSRGGRAGWREARSRCSELTAPGDVSLLRRRVRWLSCSTFGLAAFVVSRAGLLLPFVEKTL